MSGIYISGVKMPEKEQLVIFRIWGNGQVERLEGYNPFLLYGVKATDIPNHGRLIDADALKETMKIITRTEVQEIVEYDINAYKVDDAPTIIPADKGQTAKQVVCKVCDSARFIVNGDDVNCANCGSDIVNKDDVDDV